MRLTNACCPVDVGYGSGGAVGAGIVAFVEFDGLGRALSASLRGPDASPGVAGSTHAGGSTAVISVARNGAACIESATTIAALTGHAVSSCCSVCAWAGNDGKMHHNVRGITDMCQYELATEASCSSIVYFLPVEYGP